MQPAFGVDGLGCSVRLLPIAGHPCVAAYDELARFPERTGATIVSNDAGLEVRVNSTHRADLALDWVANHCLRGHRPEFTHAESHRQVNQVHALDCGYNQLTGTLGATH